MSLRQRLENLTVSQKLLAALLVLLATVLLVANLAFISAAYWISRENTAPQALHSLGRLIATPALSREALASPGKAAALLDTLESFSTVRAAALYGSDGQRLAQLPRGEKLQLPERAEHLNEWRHDDFRASKLIALPQPGQSRESASRPPITAPAGPVAG